MGGDDISEQIWRWESIREISIISEDGYFIDKLD